MRGISTGGAGEKASMILMIATFAFSFLAVLFMATALSSGSEPNFLEDVSIIKFNTSGLGKDLINVPNLSDVCDKLANKVEEIKNEVQNTAEEFKDKAQNTAEKFKDKAQNGAQIVGGITGRRDIDDIAKNLCSKGAGFVQEAAKRVNDFLSSAAQEIGIKEYYSIHIGTLCEGYYAPKFSETNAKPDVERCSQKFFVGQTDLSKKLDEGLQLGPFQFNLTQLELVQGIQDAFDDIPEKLAAMAFFFLFATLAMVVSFLLCGASLAFKDTVRLRKLALLGALGFMGFGWLTSLVGAMGVTVAAETIKSKVNEHGKKVNISASTSPALYGLVWTSVVFSTITLALLGVAWWRNRSGRGLVAQQQYAEKNQSGSTMQMEDSHGWAQMPPAGGQGPMTDVRL